MKRKVDFNLLINRLKQDVDEADPDVICCMLDYMYSLSYSEYNSEEDTIEYYLNKETGFIDDFAEISEECTEIKDE